MAKIVLGVIKMRIYLCNLGKIQCKHLYIDLTDYDLLKLQQGFPLHAGLYTDDRHDPVDSPIFKVLVQKNLDYEKFVNSDLKDDSLTDFYKANEDNGEILNTVKNELEKLLSIINGNGHK